MIEFKYASRNGDGFKLLSDLEWSLNSGHVIIIPVGYTFNVSAPKAIRKSVSGWRWLHLASCVHDYLLMKRGWSRIRAGWQFYRALRMTGVWMIVAAPLGAIVSLWKCWEPAKN